MSKPVVQAGHLEPGALWTFIHSSGKQTEYVLDRRMIAASPPEDAKSPGLSAMYALLNPATGRFAMVSEKWMREGPVNGGSHWLPKAVAPPAEVAA